MAAIDNFVKIWRMPALVIASAGGVVCSHMMFAGLLGGSALNASEPVRTTALPTTPRPTVAPPIARPTVALRAEERIATGDRIKISFFEVLDVPETKPGGKGEAQLALRTVYQRADLSGEHTIPADGTIALPRLGVVTVQGRGIEEVRNLLKQRYEQNMRRSADVGIVIIDRSPIYVTGPVKTPGAYKHVPGMIVLHAIALSGGLERRTDGGPALITFIRERERLDSLTTRLRRLNGQAARLQTLLQDRDAQIAPEYPRRGIDGPDPRQTDGETAALLDSLRLVRQSMQKAKDDVASQKLDLQSREAQIAHLSRQAALRAERVTALERLKNSGFGQTSVLLAAQGEAAEFEARWLDARLQLDATRQRLQQAEGQLGQITADQSLKVTRDLGAIAEDIAETERMLSAQRTVMEMAQWQLNETSGGPGRANVAFEIVRSHPNGPQIIAAIDTTSLLPGDVLRHRQAPAQGAPELTATSATPKVTPDGAQSGR